MFGLVEEFLSWGYQGGQGGEKGEVLFIYWSPVPHPKPLSVLVGHLGHVSILLPS